MPRKQSGGSPASSNVMNINSGYLKALSEVPVGGQVSGLPGCQTGGSIASAKVTDLLSQEQCNGGNIPSSPLLGGDPGNLPLYKTSGGGRRTKKSKSKKLRKSKSKSQKGAGSDFVNLLYARGPVNTPSNPELFKKFAGPYDQYISNECLYHEGLKGAAPFPFPQKGGKNRKSKSKSRKLNKKSRKSKSKKSLRKSKSMKGGNRKVRSSIRRKMKKSLNRRRSH